MTLRGRLRRVRRTWRGEQQADLAHALDRAQRQHLRIADLERDLARIGPQVAALEARLEDLRTPATTLQPGEASPHGPTDGVADARSLLAEVRREHERVRARISAAARFEERLTRVEEAVAGLAPRP